MTITPEWIAAVVAVATLLGGAITGWLRSVDARQERELEKIESQFKARLDSHSSTAKELERRVAEVERSYISRADHAEFRNELMAAVREIGSQVSKSLDGFGTRFEHLGDRIARVEQEVASK